MTKVDKSMPLTDHLSELRKRIIYCCAAVGAAWIGCYFFAEDIINFISRPVDTLVFIAPHEAFIAYIKISFFAALFAALPFILYQAWAFISPGLTEFEKRYIRLFIPVIIFLFFAGASFSFITIIPISLRFLLGFGTEHFQPMIAISQYISFVAVISIAFGTVFNLPIVVIILSSLGLVTPNWLKRKRKHVIILLLILSALFTPPEAFTQILLAIPLVFLYEISILLSRITAKRRK